MTLPTTNYKFGDVVLLNFPFTNLQSIKKRPAVVISSMAYSQQRPDVIVLAITSRVYQPLAFGERLVEEWRHAGLLKISVFKPLIATIEQASVLRALGQLAPRDLESLQILLRDLLTEKAVNE
jgi:mRNA interferase MazF